jgi:hypothetical protein
VRRFPASQDHRFHDPKGVLTPEHTDDLVENPIAVPEDIDNHSLAPHDEIDIANLVEHTVWRESTRENRTTRRAGLEQDIDIGSRRSRLGRPVRDGNNARTVQRNNGPTCNAVRDPARQHNRVGDRLLDLIEASGSLSVRLGTSQANQQNGSKSS